MDRGRSRSPAHIRHPSASPAGHPFGTSGLGLDQSLSQDPGSSFHPVTTAGQPYDAQQYLSTTTAAPPQFAHPAALDPSFLPSTQGPAHSHPHSHHGTPSFAPQGNSTAPDPLNLNSSSNSSNLDFSLFPDPSAGLGQGQAIDPAFLSNSLDPQLLDSSRVQNHSVNPSELMNQMATTQAHSPTPPHLLPGMNQRSPSPHASPNMNQGAFSPGHSRHASLDPSAAYGQANEWGNMAAFRGHRRTPSETYSDVSSAHASPYLGNQDSFEDANPSPLLNAQDPSLFQEVMQFGQFNLNDAQSHISPGHSPHISPRLLPQQQSLPQFQPGTFGLDPSLQNQYAQQGMGGYQGQEPFPTINQGGPGPEFGQADTMSPPEINIDFAPPSRQASFEPPKPDLQTDALSPPDRSRSRNRIRAKSDPFSSASSRASTPGVDPLEAQRSLSPGAAKGSRSPSPGSTKSSRRSSTSSVPHRDYILDLADPSRPAGAPDGSNTKRTQKHPATFQCTLCPKRFTRAYNLRSHLRTHTDERPFVCSVCGKAFARQHDRKRHEGLHSGEKKFICRGNLKDGNHWGCGRRFARADALGRHFRSEAGRVCIRPLLEEEAQEKGHWDGQNQPMDNSNGMFAPMPQQGYPGMMAPQQGYEPFPPVNGGLEPGTVPQYGLPAALLAQYPALAGLNWNELPPGPPDEMEGDISGRSSFDASSGGEMFDDDGDSYPAQQYGWASDYETNAR